MPAVDFKFQFLAAFCAAPYDDEASTSIVPFLTCTHVYLRIVFLLFTRLIPIYPTLYYMSTQKDKKIYPGRAGRNCRGKFTRTNNCSGCVPGASWSAGGNLPGGRCRGIAGLPAEPGELTRTIYRVVVPGKLSPGPNPYNVSICSRGAGKPEE